jgi:hypothetical protein
VTSGRFGAVVDGSKRATEPQKQGIEPERNEVMKEAWDDECMMNKQSQKVNSPKPILENWRLAKRSHDPDLAAPERFSSPFRRFLGVSKCSFRRPGHGLVYARLRCVIGGKYRSSSEGSRYCCNDSRGFCGHHEEWGVIGLGTKRKRAESRVTR